MNYDERKADLLEQMQHYLDEELSVLDGPIVEDGTLGGRHQEAESARKQLRTAVGTMVNRVLDHWEKLSLVHVEAAMAQAHKAKANLVSLKRRISELEDEQDRAKHAARANELVDDSWSLIETFERGTINVQLALAVVDLSGLDLLHDAENNITQMRKALAESQSGYEQLKTAAEAKIQELGVAAAAEEFGELAADHDRRAKKWFISLCISGGLLVLAVIAMFVVPFQGDNAFQVTGEAAQRGVALSIVGFFVRLTLTKFNQERNLAILYRHRLSVLAKFETLEESIEDSEGRQALMLEVVKLIFSDPQTGYVSNKGATELNISTVAGGLKRAATPGSQAS